MNKRTYQKVLKRIINYPITNPQYVLTPLEKRVKRSFDDRCFLILKEVIYELDAEDEYYKMKYRGELI